MEKLSESTLSAIIVWVVIVTVIFGILLPFVVNIPALPFYVYSFLTGNRGPALPSSCPVPNQTTGTGDLLVWYDFEDDFTRLHRVMDRSGYGNHAAVQGLFMDKSPGIVGNSSLSFSGTGHLLTLCNPAHGIKNVTFSIWFRTSDPASDYTLVTAATNDEPRTGWIIGTRTFELRDDSGRSIPLGGSTGNRNPVIPGTWNHKVITYDGERVTEYMNGQVAGEWPATGSHLGTGKAMELGSWQPFGLNYAGQIDDFRIYSYSLRPDEVTALFRVSL